MFRSVLYIILILISFPCFSRAQEKPDTIPEKSPDTIQEKTERLHSPHKASIYSAILPGLGQAYNRKYWKIPVLYAGLGTVYYFITSNNKEYQLFKDAYGHKLIYGDTAQPVNEYESKYSLDGLKNGKNYFRRNRDLSIIIFSAIYLLNIIDAAVDAHLYYWEVNDNLGVGIDPAIYRLPHNGISTGIAITFKLGP